VTLPSAPDEVAEADDVLEELDAPPPPPTTRSQPSRASAGARPAPPPPPAEEDEYGIADDIPLTPPPLPPSAPAIQPQVTAAPPLSYATPKKMSVAYGTDDDMSTVDWVLAIVCSGIGCIMGIIYIIQGKPKGKKMLLVSLACGFLWNVVSAAIRSAAHH
jgi:hypothetical protein